MIGEELIILPLINVFAGDFNHIPQNHQATKVFFEKFFEMARLSYEFFANEA